MNNESTNPATTKNFNNNQLDLVATLLASKLGLINSSKQQLIKECLNLIDQGILPTSVNLSLPSEKPKAVKPPVSNYFISAIKAEAKKIAGEFDGAGYVDWRKKESAIARFRISVRRGLKMQYGSIPTLAVNAQLDQFLSGPVND